MCLITNQKKTLVAKEDMIVYKGLRILSDDVAGSVYEYFSYMLGKLYKTEMQESTDWCAADGKAVDWLSSNYPDWSTGDCNKELVSIGEGYHAALTENRIDYHRYSDNTDIYQCTIPKGSLYHTDPTGLIVSNQIIVNHLIPKS